MCTSSAVWLPSGCGIPVIPTNDPCLMSDSEALTTRAIGKRHFQLGAIACLNHIGRAINTLDGAAYTNRILRQGRCDTRYHHHESAKTDARKRRDCHFVVSLHKFLLLPRAHWSSGHLARTNAPNYGSNGERESFVIITQARL